MPQPTAPTRKKPFPKSETLTFHRNGSILLVLGEQNSSLFQWSSGLSLATLAIWLVEPLSGETG
jgi:hypothetical protein